MRTVSELIQLWPRPSDLARELGVSPPRITDWKNRNSIPVAYWRELTRAAERRGHPEVTTDLLADLHAHPAKVDQSGFAEAEQPYQRQGAPIVHDRASEKQLIETGHFTRWRHLRRSNFASIQEINEHIRALRDEWEQR